MHIVLAGEGAIARRHIAALQRIGGVEVVGVSGGVPADTEAFASEFGIPRTTGNLDEALAWPGVDAVILTTPTSLHARQAIAVMEAGKHVLVEIPMADSLADAEAVVAAQERTGVTAMVCHTRRFNPSHQWIHRRVLAGELTLQHLVVETFFFRRENKNALGQPRSWTDHLLWHHACHTVDLFQYQTCQTPSRVWAQQGPPHPELGIAMDMTVGLGVPSGAICTLALSFNNDGPLGTFFRYICDNGTYIARYDDLVDGKEDPIDLTGVTVSMDGIEVQDREFVEAVAEGREPNASVAHCLPAMQTLDRLEHRARLMTRRRVPVVIVGGGPAGLLLARLLQLAGHESIVLERQTHEHVMGRIRAGVIEWGSADLLRSAGVGERMEREGFVHDGVGLSFSGRQLRIDFRGLVGRYVVVYGQTEIQKDLFDALDASGVAIVEQADDVAPHDVDGDSPYVTYTKDGVAHRIDCDYVAGCDGFHGVCRTVIPATLRREYERVYPFGWLGILSETPPVDHELIYAHHERGFALCSMRHSMLSRYYVQCALDDTTDDWSDDRFWSELTARLPPEAAARLVTGPSIEKSVTPLRSFVAEPLSYGRLHLAGDAGHIVPPTGAKGLNLAMADVRYLAAALCDALEGQGTTGLETYSDRVLDRVWKAVRFSWWMTTLLHRFPENGDFGQKIQEAELSYLASSEAAQRSMAENYTGLPW